MKPIINRRKDVDHISGDRLTKQLIVWTVCATSLILVMTMCRMSMSGAGVPDPIDRLATLVIGAMIGWIGKTSVDKAIGSDEPVQVQTPPNEPLEVTEAKETGGDD